MLVQRDARRWMTSEVKVCIYYSDGTEINEKVEKIKLRHSESVIRQPFSIQVRARRGVNKRAPKSILMEHVSQAVQQMDEEREQMTAAGKLSRKKFAERTNATYKAAKDLYQTMSDRNQWRFDFSDYEYEDFDNKHETKNLFNKDCTILWIRVDPDLELIRKTSIVQGMNNWLFQLLKEKDYLGQVEACEALAKYNDQLVYDTLQSVAKCEKYFFKVRKAALKSLSQISVREFRANLSKEKQFLLKYFKERTYDETIGFYRSNDFKNVLEYYVNKYLLDALAESKECKLAPIQEDLIGPIVNRILSTKLKIPEGTAVLPDPSLVREEKKDLEIMTATKEQGYSNQELMVEFANITTQEVSKVILKLLQENDNTENAFDDAFWVKRLLVSLGKLDDFKAMPLIAQQAEKYLTLDLVTRKSALLSISKGAIQCYFNMKKSIWTFKHLKQPYLSQVYFQQEIRETEAVLERIS